MTHRSDNELGVTRDWIACLMVWCIAIVMFLAIVCVLLSPAEPSVH
ncbi:MAG TPA: hypothetical protein VHL05_16350 [Terriglobales bacterium]|nr:hypothetical protein [Terriglobales bacterium]